MLRKPGSRYVAGRSETLLKVKSFLDREARVVGHQPGTGKHAGRILPMLMTTISGMATFGAKAERFQFLRLATMVDIFTITST